MPKKSASRPLHVCNFPEMLPLKIESFIVIKARELLLMGKANRARQTFVHTYGQIRASCQPWQNFFVPKGEYARS